MRGLLGLLVAVGVVLAATTAPAAAQTGGDDPLVGDLQELKETYNENLDEVPDFVEEELADERVEAVVTTDDGTYRYHAETGEDARVETLERGGADDPTVRVRTDAETLREIRDADDPAAAAVDAYDRGEITIEGVGVADTVRVEAVKAAVAVGRVLGLL